LRKSTFDCYTDKSGLGVPGSIYVEIKKENPIDSPLDEKQEKLSK
jgi:hypothetical protein